LFAPKELVLFNFINLWLFLLAVMRIFTPGHVLWSLSVLTLVAGFPGANTHGSNSGHRGLKKRCPYAQDSEEKKPDHEKRFLFDLIDSPVDSMRGSTDSLNLVLT
jgi:hypothetical protein